MLSISIYLMYIEQKTVIWRESFTSRLFDVAGKSWFFTLHFLIKFNKGGSLMDIDDLIFGNETAEVSTK